MALPLDHIVIAVQDLEAAVADYRALGFQVAIGGRHPGRTSHNALVVFADGAYLEIIAWTAPAPEERWYRTLRDHGEGLVDFALLPQSTAQALAEARGRGLDTLVGPVDGGRVRPDGAQLLWDRKSTRLNSSHTVISYAVFCLKKKKHTSELQSHSRLACRLLLRNKNRLHSSVP